MKNKNIYLGLALLLVTALVSCKKYLNVNAQSNYVYISTADDLQQLLDNYTAMNTNYPADQIISADEYYITDAALLTLSSPLRDPVSVLLYQWDKNAIQLYNATTTDWQTSYNRVYIANLVLENADKLRKTNPSSSLDGIQGAALFYRAYNLWFVAQLYTKGYNKSTASQDMGVPLRLTSDLNEKISRASVQQTYDQVIGDLKQSVSLLPDAAASPSRPSKAAAYAMLARVYLSMSDYTDALQNATSSLALNNQLIDYNTISTTSTTPFTLFNKEDLFHTATKSGQLLSPYSNANISLMLYSSYEAKDLRKQIFFKDNATVGGVAGTYSFSGNYDQSVSTYFTGLAVDEVYLTRAECYARNGDVNSALADLNTLLKTRYVNTATFPYVPVTAASANDALTRILLERKKELVMRGLRWTDLKRLNLDPGTAVTLTRTNNAIPYTLPPNDLRYALLIPTLVISAGNVTQNPR